jgi:hypothetical protein
MRHTQLALAVFLFALAAPACANSVSAQCLGFEEQSDCENAGCVFSTIDEACFAACVDTGDCGPGFSCEEVGVSYVDGGSAVNVTTTCVPRDD